MLSSQSMDDMSSIISIADDDDDGIAVVNWKVASTSTISPTPTDAASRNSNFNSNSSVSLDVNSNGEGIQENQIIPTERRRSINGMDTSASTSISISNSDSNNSTSTSYQENVTILSSQPSLSPSPSGHILDHQALSLSTLSLNENEHFEWHMNMDMNMSTSTSTTLRRSEDQNQVSITDTDTAADDLNVNERINEEHQDTTAPTPTKAPTDSISSSSEGDDSNLSLTISDVCSTISSLFNSETPDHENLNNQNRNSNSIPVSNESSMVSTSTSATSSTDANVHVSFDGKPESETSTSTPSPISTTTRSTGTTTTTTATHPIHNSKTIQPSPPPRPVIQNAILQETGSSFPSDAFLNIGGRLSIQDTIISAMPLPIYSLGGNSPPEDIHQSNSTIFGTGIDTDTATVTAINTDTDTDLGTSRTTEIDQWMEYTDQEWDEFADTAKKILHVLEGPILRSTGTGKDLDQKTIPPPPPSMEVSKSNGVTCSEQHHHHLDADTAQQILRTFRQEFICSFCNQLIVGATTLNCGCERASVCASCAVDSERLEDFNSNLLRNTNKNTNTFKAQTAVLATPVENSDLMKDVKEGECFVVEPTIVSQFPAVKVVGASADRDGQCGANLVCPSCHSVYDRHVPCHALDVAILDAVKNMTKHGINSNRMNIKLSDLKTFQSIFYMRLLIRRQEVIRHLTSLRKKHDYEEQLRLGQLLQEQERAWRTVEMEKVKDNDSVLWVNVGIFVGFVFVGLRALAKLR